MGKKKKGKSHKTKAKPKQVTDIDKSLIEAINDNSKPISTVHASKTKIKQLDEEAKKRDEVFMLTYRNERRKAVADRDAAIAYALGKQAVEVSGRTYFIKKSYLQKLKDPQKYIESVYARSLRSEQKKAYKNKDFGTVVNIAKKLHRLDKTQGLTEYKVKKSQSKIADNIKKAFGGDVELTSEQKKALIKPYKDGKKYTPIVSYDRHKLNISYV
jgi:hypothetical protein